MMLLALLVISTAGYHCGVPFLFTTLVMVYCTILTLEFHSIVLHIRKLRAALEEQIAAARSRREANITKSQNPSIQNCTPPHPRPARPPNCRPTRQVFM